jgi:hypothetical protein
MHGDLIMDTTATSVSDEILSIQTELRQRLRGQICELHIVARDNGLVLQGRCRSYYAKQLAQHGLMQASELPLLANEIDVE